MNFKLVAAAALAVFFVPQNGNAEGNPGRGQWLAETCQGCHGVIGYRNAYPSYRVPKLGGQKPAYIESALTEYRDGSRPHPTMHAQATSLSDQDIEDIAAWIATAGTASDDVDAASVATLEPAKTCIACHSKAGENITPAPPVLSGQHQDYLEHALAQYKERVRVNAVMNSMAASLSESDIERIAAFYSSLDGLHTLGERE